MIALVVGILGLTVIITGLASIVIIMTDPVENPLKKKVKKVPEKGNPRARNLV